MQEAMKKMDKYTNTSEKEVCSPRNYQKEQKK